MTPCTGKKGGEGKGQKMFTRVDLGGVKRLKRMRDSGPWARKGEEKGEESSLKRLGPGKNGEKNFTLALSAFWGRGGGKGRKRNRP